MSILGKRAEAQRRELEVKILALTFGHGRRVTRRSRHGAMATDHVDHGLLRGPHGKGRDRARQPHGRDRQRYAWVVADKVFDRLAPANEAWYLGPLRRPFVMILAASSGTAQSGIEIV